MFLTALVKSSLRTAKHYAYMVCNIAPQTSTHRLRPFEQTKPRHRSPPLLRAAPSRASGTFHHVKEADNLEETPFEFDEEAEKEIAFTLNKYPDTLQGRQSGIMPLLWIVQAQLDRAHATIKAENPRGAMAFPKSQGGGGWVPLAAMHKIAERLGCSNMDVYEVATFFTMYNRNKLGAWHSPQP